MQISRRSLRTICCGGLKTWAKCTLLFSSGILVTTMFLPQSYKSPTRFAAYFTWHETPPLSIVTVDDKDLPDVLSNDEITTTQGARPWFQTQTEKRQADIQKDVAFIQKQRLETVQRTCEKMANLSGTRRLGMSGTAFVSRDPDLVYCFVPKAGCTYWKQVFRFVTGDYDVENLHISSPEQIPRLSVHFAPWRNTRQQGLRNVSVVKQLNSQGFRFMFTRDPFARLWSAYLDKFFLPDFWHMFGRNIIKNIRPNATEKALRCGNDISFAEFLTHLVNQLDNGLGVDMHYNRIHTRCDPCQMRFDAIGKVETFTEDVRYILDVAGVNHSAWHGSAPNTDHSLDEIVMLIEYNFDGQKRWQRRDNTDCFSQLEIARRLWKTFQCNGHIGTDHTFPEQAINKIKHDKNQVRDYLKNATAHIRASVSIADRNHWKLQRSKCLHNSYKQVPAGVKDDLQRLFKYDFELFGYDIEPEYLYAI